MAQDVIGSLFLPLLLLVVIELARVAREVDLEEVVKGNPAPFFWPYEERPGILPNLGRFSFIHTVIIVILAYSEFFVVTALTPGSVVTSEPIALVSLLLIWLVWVLLPILEVDEYDAILEQGHRPISFYFHFLLGTAVVVYTPVWRLVIGRASWSDAIWGMLLFLAVGLFLTSLENELEATVSNDT